MTSLDNDPSKIRLQVHLSRNGVCSRRDAFALIKEGRVSLNGQIVTEPSTPVGPKRDIIKVDDKFIQRRNYQYVVLNKPPGYMTTKEDPHASKIVYQLLPKKLAHLLAVGRLDKETEGLLIFTNDGDLANHLTHPRFSVKKVYFAKVEGLFSEDAKKKLEKGIYMAGSRTQPARINIIRRSGKQTDLTIEVQEGKKRMIRIMFFKVGHPVDYLKRISQGPIKLGGLPLGNWRYLTAQEIESLKAL